MKNFSRNQLAGTVFLLILTLAVFCLYESPSQKNVKQPKVDSNTELKNESSNLKHKAEQPLHVLEDNSAPFITSCENSPFDSDDPTINKFKNGDPEVFTSSNSLNSRLSFLVISNFTSKSDEQESLTRKLLDLKKDFKNEELLDYLLLGSCVTNEPNPLCKDALIEELISANQSNGAIWFQKAALEMHRNNTNAALGALAQVIAAPNYNNYWAESILMFNSAYQEAGLSHPGARLIVSIGASAALPGPQIGSIFQLCREQSRQRADIYQLCIDAGARITEGATSELERGLGLSMQRTALKATGRNDELAKFDQLVSQARVYNQSLMKAHELMLFDHELSNYWLTQLKLFGFARADNELILEAVRLSNNPDYAPCPIES